MVDVIQIVLLSVIVLLALILIILGVQVFFILKDVRVTLGKANKVLDNMDSISESVSRPVSSITDMLGGPSTITAILKIIQTLRK